MTTKTALTNLLKLRWRNFAGRNPQLVLEIIGYLIEVTCFIMTDYQVAQLYHQPMLPKHGKGKRIPVQRKRTPKEAHPTQLELF